eukprot:Em0001g2035a
MRAKSAPLSSTGLTNFSRSAPGLGTSKVVAPGSVPGTSAKLVAPGSVPGTSAVVASPEIAAGTVAGSSAVIAAGTVLVSAGTVVTVLVSAGTVVAALACRNIISANSSRLKKSVWRKQLERYDSDVWFGWLVLAVHQFGKDVRWSFVDSCSNHAVVSYPDPDSQQLLLGIWVWTSPLFIFYRMRIFAKVTGGESGKEETLVVACTDTSRPVSSIVDELKAREEVSGVGERYQLRLAENGAILNDKSRIEDVLKDDDVVLVALQGAISGEKVDFRQTNSCIIEDLTRTKEAEWIALDGHSLRVEDLVKIGKGKYRVKLSEEAKVAVSKARKVVDDIVASGKVVYGINTGFGRFANIVISHSQLDELQMNLLTAFSLCWSR